MHKIILGVIGCSECATLACVFAGVDVHEIAECARMCPNVPEFARVDGLNVPQLLVDCVFSPASV